MQRHNTQRTTRRHVLRIATALAVTTVLGTTAIAFAQAGLRLIVGGKTVSTDIRMIDGRPFVPLADMARAMNGLAARHRGGGYEITQGGVDTTTPFVTSPNGGGGRGGAVAGGGGTGGAVAGGANQVNGARGKIGQVLFNGKWRFSVLSVTHTASYDSVFLPEKRTFTPNGDADELVVVRCRLNSGQNETKAPMLSPIHPHHTALADNQGQSYAPTDYDKRGGHTDEGPDLLPGAQTEFAILFSVPKGAVLKDLVFSVQNVEDAPDGGTDVRISLAQ